MRNDSIHWTDSNSSINDSCSADSTACLLGSLGIQIASSALCTVSAVLNVFVLVALLRFPTSQARGFVALVVLDIFMNAFLTALSLMAIVNRSQTLQVASCPQLHVATSLWRIAFFMRSWWIVAITTVRYTVVIRPLTAPLSFTVRRQVCLLCILLAGSVASIATLNTISNALNDTHSNIYHLTIALEVLVSSGLPSAVVAVLTVAMTVKLVRRSRMRTGMPSQSDRSLKATKTLLLVCTVFFLVSFPHLLYEAACSVCAILNFTCKQPLPHWLDALGEAKSILLSVDSALNFAIYFAMCNAFRLRMLNFLGLMRLRNGRPPRHLPQRLNNFPLSMRLRQDLGH